MKKVDLLLYLILSTLIFIYSCTKDENLKVEDNPVYLLEKMKENESPKILTENWETGTYLEFRDDESIQRAYSLLEESLSSGIKRVELGVDIEGFTSMLVAYDKYEDGMLDAGFSPDQVQGIPIIDDALASLINVDGIVQVGNEIQYFSPTIYAKAPIEYKDLLRSILEGKRNMTPDDIKKGIDITFRGKTDCRADFSVQINHSALEVFVNYTGTSISGGDKTISWSVDGSDYTDQTGFSHQYESAGTKQICVTYTETEVVPDTIYFYTTTTRDTAIVTSSGDSTFTITEAVQNQMVVNVRKVTCISTYCKDIELGGCTADFDITEGVDNIYNFTDNSSTMYGEITGWLWTFGDGDTSTVRNPTHVYDCDKKYTATLTIYSDQCPGGQRSTSRTIEASGNQCCDRNPQSDWLITRSPEDGDKQIRYRYDMGTNWDWLLDQDFKAKIKYYENRRGNGWFKGRTRWRKSDGLLDVDFDGNVYARDEDDCVCQESRSLLATPVDKRDKQHTFRDDLSRSAFGTGKTHWMKDESPIFIEYKVDGVTYVIQHCQDTPGFHCE